MLASQVEMQKKLLSCHVGYDPMTLFKILDDHNLGYLTVEEFTNTFGQKVASENDLQSIISLMNVSEDSLTNASDHRLTFINFMKGLKPHESIMNFSSQDSYSFMYL